ncbi:uncharacterized protein A4U43_C09F8630 [Asparagus officinalis]|uniref:Beta-glucosidase n=1 Tax=Asparagus officinalis TaxID=4686 RepID=A0A5P1E680_ASPOF|nr:furostanol glycoside 26-O-beta-glucosidase-like [Asparagus officinalis]ONK58141.1 uncharacterized protein A4U43_C09F8630 [Asparagus officinalis]
MAKLRYARIQATNDVSHLSSVRSKGRGTPLATNEIRTRCQIRRRRSSLRIISSVNETATATDPLKEEAGKAVPAGVVLGRSSFPLGFAFGTATSAYQVEGAWNEGGKGPSIWDTFNHQQKGKIKDGSNGDVATDAYHKYKKDIKLMKQMGVDSYRFSVSWSRILPDGTVKGGVNEQGIKYYNNLIDKLIENGITPFVTIFHWDVPQALEDKYGGFRNRKIVDDFKDYARVCFQEFGDRVKHWITLNEPWSFCTLGYSVGINAPGRGSKTLGCSVGNSLTEPYIVAHNMILAHGAAAALYRHNFKAVQRGEIGITQITTWFIPYSNSHEDKAAAQRSIDFMLGWFMDPLVNGDYPFIMRLIVGDRLPSFTKKESEMIKGSYDFMGLNYYTSAYARALPTPNTFKPSNTIEESYATQLNEKDGKPIGKLEGSSIYVVPIGIKDLLVYTKKRYKNPKIYITENGTAQLDNGTLTIKQARADEDRIDYISLHLAQIRTAIQEEVNVKGYFTWSLTDNFEWYEGYSERFGLIYIDYAKGLKRYPKASFKWYRRFLMS